MKRAWTRASYLALMEGSPKARPRVVTGMPLLDRRNRAYENTSKLPQSTGHAQAVTLVCRQKQQ
jgi:hypothetical protein